MARHQLLESFVGVLVAAGLPQGLRLLRASAPETANSDHQPGGAELREGMEPAHLSIASCTLASSQQKLRELLLVLVGGHGGLVVLQLVDGLLELLLLFEQRALGGIARGGRIRAQAHQRESSGQLALAVFGAGVALALALAGVFQHGSARWPGASACRRTRWSCARRSGRLRARRRSRSCRHRRRGRAGPRPSSGRIRWRSFPMPVLVAVITTRPGLRRNSIDPPLELVMLTTSCRVAGMRSSSAASSAPVMSGPGRLNLYSTPS